MVGTPINRDRVESVSAYAVVLAFVALVGCTLYAELKGIVLADSAAFGGVSMLILREMAALVIGRSENGK